ncbi:MAG: SDR family oxidoreductase [Pseudomonadota bacterium]
MPISLEGKTVIVTCATQDLGRTIAQRFLDAGAKVMLADGDEKAPANAEAGLIGDEERFARFHYVAQDKLCITNLIAATTERFGEIDVLVNSAQNAVTQGQFLEISVDDFDASIGPNVRAVFQLSQAVAKRMLEKERDEDEPAGTIVNISSIAARRTVPGLLAFSVASAALDQLTRSMAASLAGHGVRVNAVAIGGVLTERLKEAMREHDDLREDMIRVTPMQRLAEMDEAADTALFLASPHASYITGQIVAVDGGRTLLDPLSSPIR